VFSNDPRLHLYFAEQDQKYLGAFALSKHTELVMAQDLESEIGARLLAPSLFLGNTLKPEVEIYKQYSFQESTVI
jgi:hypothetical protein